MHWLLRNRTLLRCYTLNSNDINYDPRHQTNPNIARTKLTTGNDTMHLWGLKWKRMIVVVLATSLSHYSEPEGLL